MRHPLTLLPPASVIQNRRLADEARGLFAHELRQNDAFRLVNNQIMPLDFVEQATYEPVSFLQVSGRTNPVMQRKVVSVPCQKLDPSVSKSGYKGSIRKEKSVGDRLHVCLMPDVVSTLVVDWIL